MQSICIEKIVPDLTAATLLPYQTPVRILYMCHYSLLLIWNCFWLYTSDFIDEFLCLVHKLSVILNGSWLQNRSETWVKNIMAHIRYVERFSVSFKYANIRDLCLFYKKYSCYLVCQLLWLFLYLRLLKYKVSPYAPS